MGRYWVAVLSTLVAVSSGAQWRTHEVQLLNGSESISVPAQFQIVTEPWNRVVAVPYIAYAPEKDRVLMLVSCDYPHQAMLLYSDDHGATWSAPEFMHLGADGKPDTGMGIGLTYIGDGKAFVTAGHRWFTRDFGKTWEDYGAIPATPDGATWNGWDPMFVDRDPATKAVKRLVETGYSMDVARWESNGGPGYSKGHIHSSVDEGRTWVDVAKVPEWDGASEITIIRAANGDLVAGCRTDKPASLGEVLDHYEGLAVSISKDDGKTWSPLNRLYAWGRHHPSLVLLPDGTLVMTYVVRKGYTDAADGFPRFAVEAIISKDNGQSWDLDHRYVLHWWKGNRTGPNSWWPSSQATSTLLMPDGSLLTAFGTGFRTGDSDKNQPAPRDVGLVSWKLSDATLDGTVAITKSALDSDARNVFDPKVLRSH